MKKSKETNKELTLEDAVASLQANLNTPLTQDQINKINKILENDSENEDLDLLKAKSQYSRLTSNELIQNMYWLVKFSIQKGSISKARGAELLGVSLIDMDTVLKEIL